MKNEEISPHHLYGLYQILESRKHEALVILCVTHRTILLSSHANCWLCPGAPMLLPHPRACLGNTPLLSPQPRLLGLLAGDHQAKTILPPECSHSTFQDFSSNTDLVFLELGVPMPASLPENPFLLVGILFVLCFLR